MSDLVTTLRSRAWEDRHHRKLRELAARRIEQLEAALKPLANHLVEDSGNEFIGGYYAIDVVQTAKACFEAETGVEHDR